MAIAWFAISLAVIFFLGNLFFVVHGWWAHGGFTSAEQRRREAWSQALRDLEERAKGLTEERQRVSDDLRLVQKEIDLLLVAVHGVWTNHTSSMRRLLSWCWGERAWRKHEIEQELKCVQYKIDVKHAERWWTA